jgi:hypothetical protein
MEDWEEYQENSAQFFRGLGMNAITNKAVQGVRSVHKVDVLVTTERPWLKQMWIVECKHQKRPITKLHVLALQSILNDAGADHGFLLSEVGFQSGTIRFAQSSNITLSNLEDLYADAAEEISSIRLDRARKRLISLRDQLDRVDQTERSIAPLPSDEDSAHWARSPANYQLLGRILVAELAVADAELDKWPVLDGIARQNGLLVSNLNEFAMSLELEVTAIEAGVAMLEKVVEKDHGS